MEREVAIHNRAASYSDRWAEACRERGVPYRLVNCHDSDIIGQLQGCRALLWHWHHAIPTDLLTAIPVLRSAEMMGLAVFPDIATCWHFDNKVAQKYLLEAIGAPLVPTWIFYTRQEALEWAATATYPKVFKLSRGAGAVNVQLMRSASDVSRLAARAFGRGFNPVAGYFRDSASKLRNATRSGSLWAKVRRAPRTILNRMRLRRRMNPEREYFYAQEFIPDNNCDVRITVIGDRAFGFTRMVRKGDFRASGSGSISYDMDLIDKRCVETAFDVAGKLGAQSVAFDLLSGAQGKPVIGEISYSYVSKAVYDCPGHWDSSLAWHEGHVWPEDCILEDLLASVRE